MTETGAANEKWPRFMMKKRHDIGPRGRQGNQAVHL